MDEKMKIDRRVISRRVVIRRNGERIDSERIDRTKKERDEGVDGNPDTNNELKKVERNLKAEISGWKANRESNEVTRVAAEKNGKR